MVRQTHLPALYALQMYVSTGSAARPACRDPRFRGLCLAMWGPWPKRRDGVLWAKRRRLGD
uniref:ARAD1D31680p n=1 Tax=Blastobotrys adeninivorans TaxID=409370 RepID=A0A060TBY5_BLAAD